jgi:glutathione S-transferase
MGRFVSIADARDARGLRLECIRNVPSPWTEAAKGIFRVKGLPCLYAARSQDDGPDAVSDWADDSSVPVVAYEKEPLRTGWAEILILAERLSPEPALIPSDPEDRVRFFGLAHEICGELGIGWCMRLLMVRASLDHSGGGSAFPPEVGARLAVRCGFHPAHVRIAEDRVVESLHVLDAVLAGKPYFFESGLTALDIYWATMANLISPLDETQLPMRSTIRGVYTSTRERVLAALTPALKAHQENVYRQHLELPVPL